MNLKKVLFKIVSYGLVSVALVYFGLQLNRHLADIPPIDWSFAIVLTLVLSIVVTALNTLTIALKYYEGRPVIDRLERVSRPGLRIYRGRDAIPQVMNGLGVAIVTTPKGVMTDRKARATGVGGEVLCYVA